MALLLIFIGIKSFVDLTLPLFLEHAQIVPSKYQKIMLSKILEAVISYNKSILAEMSTEFENQRRF